MRVILVLLALFLLPPGLPVEAQTVASAAFRRVHSGVAEPERESVLARQAGLDVIEIPLEEALDKLHVHSGVFIAFSPSLLPEDLLVSCPCSEMTVAQALKQILNGTGFTYSVFRDQVLIEKSVVSNPALSERLPMSFLASRLRIGELEPGSPRQVVGTVTGRVTNAQNGNPVENAQVLISGLDRGTLTDNRGLYRLVGIPAGTYEIEAQSIGYRSAATTAVVDADQVTQVDFQLLVSAVALDELVVTGRAAGTSRREIGTAVAAIDVTTLREAPAQNISQLLQARTPGLTVMPTGGKVGQGSRIVLRGLGSVSQTNTPIIYVDGVRIDNSASTALRTEGPTWSGLDDVNPQDIERIEVVRGPSAATLYGTEASPGVIQIFTRRGSTGEARWDLRTDYGIIQTPRDWWRQSQSVYSDWYYDNIVRTGRQQGGQLSVSGGQEGFTYYASVTGRDVTGVLPNDGEGYVAFRSNIQVLPRPTMVLTVSSGYSRRRVQQAPDGNNQEGQTINGLVGGPNGQWNPPEKLRALEMFQNASRFTGGATLEYSPGRFLHRITVGADVFNADDTEFLPPGVIPRFLGGYKGNYRRDATNVNLDLVSTFRTPLTEAIRSTTSLGFQAFSRKVGSNSAYGQTFPFLGLETVSATSSGYNVGETRIEEKSAGFFLEQQFAFRDRLFVTLGARADGHSAFGREVDYQIYPKADVSYVLSANDFWSEEWGSLRLRGAYGTAGQQPAAFSAVRTWSPVSAGGGFPAVTPSNVGNPDLAPEVSHELEMGVDAVLLDERLSVEVTYFNQRTKDALYQVRQPPSEGFLTTQLENVGEISNQGLEMGVRAQMLELDRLRWSALVNVSLNKNEVISLGGEPFLNHRWMQFTREGYPVAGFFGDRLMMRNGEAGKASVLLKRPDGTLPEGWDYIGPAIPKRTIQLGSTFDVGRSVSLSVLMDHQGGHFRHDHTLRWLMDPRRDVRQDVEYGGRIIATAGPVASICRDSPNDLVEQICRTNSLLTEGYFVVPADFWKLREVTASYRLPERVSESLRASSVTLTLAGRNLWRWMKQESLEPEANLYSDETFQRNAYFDTPTPRQLILSVSARF